MLQIQVWSGRSPWVKSRSMRGKRAAEIAGYVETCGVTGLDIPDGPASNLGGIPPGTATQPRSGYALTFPAGLPKR
jgi:hypothetical protein